MARDDDAVATDAETQQDDIGPHGRSRESHDSNDDDDDDVAMDPEAQQDDQKRKDCSHTLGCNVMTGARPSDFQDWCADSGWLWAY